MKKFNYTGLWTVIRNPETAPSGTEEPAAALDEFADELHDYCRREKDLAERTRTLRFAQSELTVAQEHIHTGAGKKCGNTVNYCTSRFAHWLRTGHCQDGTRTPGTVCKNGQYARAACQMDGNDGRPAGNYHCPVPCRADPKAVRS